MHTLTSLDGEEIKRNNLIHLDGISKPKLHPRIQERRQLTGRLLGHTEANKRADQLNALSTSSSDIALHPETAARLASQGAIFNMRFSRTDPLMMRFFEVAGRKIGNARMSKVLANIFESANPGIEPTFSMVRAEDNISLLFCYPPNLTERRPQIVEKVLTSYQLTDEDREMLTRGFGMQGKAGVIEFGRFTIPYDYVLASEKEEGIHPLMTLSELGFPTPLPKPEPTLSGSADALARDILDNQIRYMNRRGIRVPLSHPAQRRLRYHHVDFHRSLEGQGTDFSIAVAGLALAGRLDQYYNLDLQGREFNQPSLADAVRYTLVALLHDFLCEDPNEASKGSATDPVTEIQSRMGHLTYLGITPRGVKKHWTKQASDYYLAYEGKDLATKSLQRQAEDERGRHTTYTRPVMEKADNLPPSTVNIPNAVQYSNIWAE